MYNRFIIATLFALSFALCNAQSYQAYQKEVIRLYPDAKQIDWEEKGNYVVAVFTHNGFEMKTWMDKQAQWVMSVADIETTDQLPASVYNTFAYTNYSQWNVINVYWVTFSDKQEQFIIKVNQDNSSQTNDLFFAPSGKEIRNLDVSYEHVALTPMLFDIEKE